MVDTARRPSLEELRARRDEILGISRARGASEVYVFGSVARGESGSDSDIDFLVAMEPDRSALDLSELILDLQEALDRPVDVVEIPRDAPHSEQILREAVPL